LTPAGGVTVLYTVTSGTATLACGLPVCPVASTGDGRATMNVTAVGSATSIVTASLTNGASPVLTLYGSPGASYAITVATNLLQGGTWTLLTNVTLANAVQAINPGPITNRMEFFRASGP